MTRRTLQIAAIIAAVALVGTVSLAVIATGGGSGPQGGGFLSHLHQFGRHLHGGGQHHDQMARLIEQLELTPAQLQRLEKIHEIAGTFGSEGHGSMAELHNQLVSQFEHGYIETTEIRQVIDGHVEQIREVAYVVTDELVALVNGLDAKQRETLQAHLRGH